MIGTRVDGRPARELCAWVVLRAAPALCLAAAACGGARAGGGALAWQPPVALSPANGSGAAPALAAGADGRITAAWTGAPDSGTDGRLIVRPDVRVMAATEVRDPIGSLTIYGETPPKLAYGPDGTLYAAYLVTKAERGHQWPTNALRLVSSSDRGRHWSAPVTVQADTSNNGSTDDHALLIAPDGTIYLTWLALVGDTSHTFVSVSRDRGRTWSRRAMIDREPSCPCCRTAMAAGPGGRLFAAWRKIFGTGGASEVRDIVVASSADHGATWSPPVRVHADDWHVNYCPDAGPSIKVGGDGVVHAAWWTGKPGAAGVRYAQSRDGGHTFGTPVALGVASASRAAHAQLALADAHRVVVVWDDGTRAIPPVVVRVSEDDGLTFNRGDTLTAPGESAGYPVLAIAHDTVVVAWQQRTLAGVAADSLREQERAAAMHGAASTAPSAARWINRVGSWSVVMRAAALR